MFTQSPKLACTISGVGFEEWKRRPVYAVHCKTYSVAKQLCGIDLAPGQGLATPMHSVRTDALSSFRCLRAYRTPEANQLRTAVARHVRAQRRTRALSA